jgi:hypothetical protein
MQITVNIPTDKIKAFLKERFDKDFQDSDLVEFLQNDIETVYGQELMYNLSDSMQDSLVEWFFYS